MSRPRLVPIGRQLLPGLAAVGLFAVMAVTVLTAGDTGPSETFVTDRPGLGDGSIVSGLGYALVGDPAAAGGVVAERTESFLVALVVLAVALDAALDGALTLADRDERGDGE